MAGWGGVCVCVCCASAQMRKDGTDKTVSSKHRGGAHRVACVCSFKLMRVMRNRDLDGARLAELVVFITHTHTTFLQATHNAAAVSEAESPAHSIENGLLCVRAKEFDTCSGLVWRWKGILASKLFTMYTDTLQTAR